MVQHKVEGLKYSYSMKGHMDPDYHGKVEGFKYSYSTCSRTHWTQTTVFWSKLFGKKGLSITPIL